MVLRFLPPLAGLLLAHAASGAGPGARLDRNGDPLPPGAVARLGSVHLRHPDTVCAVAFTPDGKTLFSAGADKVIRVWDIASGKQVRAIDAHKEEVHGLAVTPDGKSLVSAGFDRNVRLWSLKDFEETESLETHDDCIEGLALSPDGRLLATAGRDHRVGLWVLGSRQQWLAGHQSVVGCVAFSPDNKTLASGSWDKTVRLWDADTGKSRGVLKGHEGSVDALAYAADGKLLAAGSTGGVVRLWDPVAQKETRQIDTRLGRVWALAFTRDGKTLLAGGDGGLTPGSRRASLTGWDVASGKLLWSRHAHSPSNPAREKSDFRTPYLGPACIVLTPDGKKAATAGADGRVRFWNPATGADVGGADGHDDTVTGVVFLSGGKSLVTAGLDGTLLWWDTAGKVTRRVDVGPGCTNVLARSADGAMLAAAGADGVVRLWDADRGTKLRDCSRPHGAVRCLAFSPDGKTLASTSPAANRTLLLLWNPADGKEVRRLDMPEPDVQSVVFSADGKLLAAVSRDEPVLRWEVATGKPLPLLPDRLRDVTRLAYSPEGLLAGGFGGSRSVVLWDGAGKKTGEFEEEGSAVLGLAFAPDGQTVATAHADYALRLWEVRTGKERRVFRGHLGPLRTLAVAPDGRLLATASADQTVLLWDRLAVMDGGQKRLTVDRMQAHWRELGENDPHRAYDAVCALAAAPETALDFLAPRLGALAKLDDRQIMRWINDLDARSFKVREDAMENLGRLGRLVEDRLRKVLAGQPSLELRRRAAELLRRLADTGPGDEWKQFGRAIEVLEQIGTEPARKVLEKLADGDDLRPTREARAALQRLGNRKMQ